MDQLDELKELKYNHVDTWTSSPKYCLRLSGVDGSSAPLRAPTSAHPVELQFVKHITENRDNIQE
jgi:hypothetical protein